MKRLLLLSLLSVACVRTPRSPEASAEAWTKLAEARDSGAKFRALPEPTIVPEKALSRQVYAEWSAQLVLSKVWEPYYEAIDVAAPADKSPIALELAELLLERQRKAETLMLHMMPPEKRASTGFKVGFVSGVSKSRSEHLPREWEPAPALDACIRYAKFNADGKALVQWCTTARDDQVKHSEAHFDWLWECRMVQQAPPDGRFPVVEIHGQEARIHCPGRGTLVCASGRSTQPSQACLAPDLFEAIWTGNAASALKEQGRYAEAKESYELALSLDPMDTSLKNSMAWLLATAKDDNVRDGQRAVELAKAVLAVSQSAWHIDTAAAAYAELGNFERAVVLEEQAIKMLGDDADAAPYKKSLELFRNEQPVRE